MFHLQQLVIENKQKTLAKSQADMTQAKLDRSIGKQKREHTFADI